MEGQFPDDDVRMLSPRAHVEHRPEMYIGGMHAVEAEAYGCEQVDGRDTMVKRSRVYTPGLYQIVDELITNALDFAIKQGSKVSVIAIDVERDAVQVYNDGDGIRVEKSQAYGKYIPELLLGEMLSSTNYNDEIERITAGKNGVGAKACNIFSKRFELETASVKTKRIFYQKFYDNMSRRDPADVRPFDKATGYTRVKAWPVFERFDCSEMSDDMIALLKKRAYDIKIMAPATTRVVFNGQVLDVRSLADYTRMYVRPDVPLAYEQKVNGKWRIAAAIKEGGFEHMSFVNGICTDRGGHHVNYFAQKIVSHMIESFTTKHHPKFEISPTVIKNSLFLVVNAEVPNPEFESQGKHELTTPPTKFLSTTALRRAQIDEALNLSSGFYLRLFQGGIEELIENHLANKARQAVRKTDGVKSERVTGIPKLEDANFAGTRAGHECTLILTEGDSAKAMAMEGLAILGHDRYGVYPLRGKLINARDISEDKKAANKELCEIKKILGLSSTKDPEATRKGLRYGKIMIMSDADADGSHIRGLVINLFHALWPFLLEQPNFMWSLHTPIVRVLKPQVRDFYSMSEFQQWYAQNPKAEVKYFKGLGTWKTSDARELFSNKLHMLAYGPLSDKDTQALRLAFDKNQAGERKKWIAERTGTVFEDVKGDMETYDHFINNELVQFSIYDVERSIPNLIDGLKPSQRKVLYGLIKRNSDKEAKVSQIGGYVSEHAAYHHGEAALYATIIGMAQTFVGSGNNLPLLAENGTFGSRNRGGKDAAAPRYICTALNPVVGYLFPRDDLPLLEYQDEDGQQVEPKYYVPIVPLILINGTRGIGTGYSSTVPYYHPLTVIARTRLAAETALGHADPKEAVAAIERLTDDQLDVDIPWHRGFTGTIVKKGRGGYESRGVYELLPNPKNPEVRDRVRITELPLGYWTEDYKEYLEENLVSPNSRDVLDRYYSQCTSNKVDFTIIFKLDLSDKDPDIIEHQALELRSSSGLNTTNMHLFDPKCRIQKYANTGSIVRTFAITRFMFYVKRKANKLHELTIQIAKAASRARFIALVIQGELVLNNRPKSDIVKQLEQHGDWYTEDGNYDYLLQMPLYSLTKERFDSLKEQEAKLRAAYDQLLHKHEAQIWIDELDALYQFVDADLSSASESPPEYGTSPPVPVRQQRRKGAAAKK